jgi:hypothetical protein
MDGLGRLTGTVRNRSRIECGTVRLHVEVFDERNNLVNEELVTINDVAPYDIRSFRTTNQRYDTTRWNIRVISEDEWERARVQVEAEKKAKAEAEKKAKAEHQERVEADRAAEAKAKKATEAERHARTEAALARARESIKGRPVKKSGGAELLLDTVRTDRRVLTGQVVNAGSPAPLTVRLTVALYNGTTDRVLMTERVTLRHLRPGECRRFVSREYPDGSKLDVIEVEVTG